MLSVRGCLGATAALLTLGSGAGADFVVSADKAAFLASTGATDATGPLPTTGFIGAIGGSPPGPTTTVGSVTYQAVRYRFDDFSARLPGSELAISFGADGLAHESLNLLAAGPVFALGFDFVEPQFDPNVNAPFAESTFTVTVKNGTTTLFTFAFNAPNDTAAFVGVSGDAPFDRLEIRETIGDDENEFFGRVYTAAVAVPEPSSLASIGLGLAGLAAVAGWRRRVVDARREAGSHVSSGGCS